MPPHRTPPGQRRAHSSQPASSGPVVASPLAALATAAAPGPSSQPHAGVKLPTPSPKHRRKRPRTEDTGTAGAPASATPVTREAAADAAASAVTGAADIKRRLLGAGKLGKEGREGQSNNGDKLRKPKSKDKKKRRQKRDGSKSEREPSLLGDATAAAITTPGGHPSAVVNMAAPAITSIPTAAHAVAPAGQVDDDWIARQKPADRIIKPSKRDRAESRAQLELDIAAKTKAREERLRNERERDAELAELRRQVAVHGEEMEKAAEAHRRQVAALEKDVEDGRKEVAVKEQAIQDKHSHHTAVLDAVNCQICYEVLDDPHVLVCGHSACRSCFITWFRSANAYRTPFADQITADSDLTYRTKICPTCRTKVFHAPARSFTLQSILDALGVRHPQPSQNQDRNPWTLTFPPNQESYVYDDDGTSRCPQCHHEVSYGECEQCGTQFSDNGMGEEGASQLGDLLALDHLDDDSDLSDLSGSDLSDADSAAAGGAGMQRLRHILASARREVAHARRGIRRLNRSDASDSASDTEDRLRFIDDEADESSGSASDHMVPLAGPHGRPGRLQSPRAGMHRGIRTALQILEEENGSGSDAAADDDEEDYESSFIDDDALGSRAGSELDDVLDDASDSASVLGGSSEAGRDSDVMSVDAPGIDELRRRRAARLGPPPVVAGHVSEEESDAAPVERRSTRRARTVRVDTDESD